MELKGMVAIITGGGSGIGRATAILLSQKGVKVAVCGRRYEVLAETVSIIQNGGGEGIAIETDVRELKDVKNLIDTVKEKFSQINILVNSAGIAIAKPLLDIEESEWDSMLDTNLKSIFLTCKMVIPEMLKNNHGVIINISSTLGKTGIANFTAYSASKFGIIGLTEALAEEYRSTSIRIYTICPGRTATPMQRQLGGERIAKLSMPPEKVANKIINLVIEKTFLSSGSHLIINDQSLQLNLYDIYQKYAQWYGHYRQQFWKLKQKIKNLI